MSEQEQEIKNQSNEELLNKIKSSKKKEEKKMISPGLVDKLAYIISQGKKKGVFTEKSLLQHLKLNSEDVLNKVRSSLYPEQISKLTTEKKSIIKDKVYFLSDSESIILANTIINDKELNNPYLSFVENPEELLYYIPLYKEVVHYTGLSGKESIVNERLLTEKDLRSVLIAQMIDSELPILNQNLKDFEKKIYDVKMFYLKKISSLFIDDAEKYDSYEDLKKRLDDQLRDLAQKLYLNKYVKRKDIVMHKLIRQAVFEKRSLFKALLGIPKKKKINLDEVVPGEILAEAVKIGLEKYKPNSEKRYDLLYFLGHSLHINRNELKISIENKSLDALIKTKFDIVTSPNRVSELGFDYKALGRHFFIRERWFIEGCGEGCGDSDLLYEEEANLVRRILLDYGKIGAPKKKKKAKLTEQKLDDDLNKKLEGLEKEVNLLYVLVHGYDSFINKFINESKRLIEERECAAQINPLKEKIKAYEDFLNKMITSTQDQTQTTIWGIKNTRKILDMYEKASKQDLVAWLKPILEWNKTPKEIKKELDEYIIGQERGKQVIATEIYFHYLRLGNAIKESLEKNGGDLEKALSEVQAPKANILFIGPSGSGKTYTAEKVSAIVSVPFIKEDMTKFSETGYVGRDLSEIVTDLIHAAKGNPYLAQLGIVFLDEIDKIYSANVVGRDVSGKGVQNGLLKLVEGADSVVEFEGKKVKFSTKNILFVASGAFEKLEDLVKGRLKRQGIEVQEGKTWKDYVINEDFIAYGMERQLLGRFPVKAFYDPLGEEELMQILRSSKDSPLLAYQNDLKLAGIELEIEEEGLREICKKAVQERTGARGLIGVLFDVLLPERYEKAGTYKGKIILTKENVIARLEKYQKPSQTEVS